MHWNELNPTFNEEFVMVILPTSPPTFTISIWDKNRFESDNQLGYIQFEVRT